MRKSLPNMSAALAVAIEHQVDDMIGAAKMMCTLHAHLADIQAIAELEIASEAIYIRDRAERMLAFSRRRRLKTATPTLFDVLNFMLRLRRDSEPSMRA